MQIRKLLSTLVTASLLISAGQTVRADYSNTVISFNPVAYWPLTETNQPPTTVMATNYGGIGATVNGTYRVGTIPGAPGPFGSNSVACRFVPASGGYVDCTADPSLDLTNAMTLVAWFKGAPTDAWLQSFAGKSDTSWRANLDQNGFAHFGDGTNPEAVGATFVNDANWHFFAGVFDGTSNYLYIDGVLDGTAPAPTPVAGSSTSAVIGGDGNLTNRIFQGSVAQVAVFNYSLATSQIQQIYNSATLPPEIVSQPASQTNSQGTTASLTVTALGSADLAYQWYITNFLLAGQTTSALILSNVQPGDAGDYAVVVTNAYGSLTSSVATLTVVPGPPIIQQDTTLSAPPLPNLQPLSVRAWSGLGLTYSVAVGGTPPIKFQWQRDGANVPGATNASYTLTTLAGSNSYLCVISNAFGSTNSLSASVTGTNLVTFGSTFAINFMDAANDAFYDGIDPNGVNVTFTGPGAYVDAPGNTNWNGFGQLGPGTFDTVLPWFNSTNAPQESSDGTLTPVTLTVIYGFDSPGVAYGPGSVAFGSGYPNTCATCPSLVLGNAAVVNADFPGVGATDNPMGGITISNVPPGSYKLFLYGANFYGDQGASFAFNSGTPHNGINTTTNPGNASPLNVFAEGATYVEFDNVAPDTNGLITGTFGTVSNSITGQTGEGYFNGLQLVKVATASPTLNVKAVGNTVTVTWSPAIGILQSAPNATGPYSDVSGATSPYSAPVSGPRKFFRVRP